MVACGWTLRIIVIIHWFIAHRTSGARTLATTMNRTSNYLGSMVLTVGIDVCRVAATSQGIGFLHLPQSPPRSRPSVLEPVEDVGIPHWPEFLEKLADPYCLVPGRVDHPAVEDGVEDRDLLWLRVPSHPHWLTACLRVKATRAIWVLAMIIHISTSLFILC